jgi:hypothetical protein
MRERGGTHPPHCFFNQPQSRKDAFAQNGNSDAAITFLEHAGQETVQGFSSFFVNGDMPGKGEKIGQTIPGLGHHLTARI